MRRVPRATAMPGLLTSVAALLSMCVALAAVPPAAAAAAPAHGQLSATEYLQLSAQLASLKAALDRKDVNWNVARAACRRAGRSSALLRSQRRYCLASVTTTRAIYTLESHSLRCAADARGAATTPTIPAPSSTTTDPTPTTTTPSPTTTLTNTTPTTPTTTTSVSPAQLEDVACLNGDYQTIGRVAKPFYDAMVANRRLVLARGFRGTCFTVLGDSAANVRKVETFAFAARQVAADAALMTRVFHGKAPASALNATVIAGDGLSFETAIREIETTKSSQRISACPHD